MRISDWSSDVCSSDLCAVVAGVSSTSSGHAGAAAGATAAATPALVTVATVGCAGAERDGGTDTGTAVIPVATVATVAAAIGKGHGSSDSEAAVTTRGTIATGATDPAEDGYRSTVDGRRHLLHGDDFDVAVERLGISRCRSASATGATGAGNTSDTSGLHGAAIGIGAAALSTVTAVSIGISHGGGCSGVVVAELVLRVRRRTGRKGYDQGESRGPGENISQHNDLLAVMGPQSRC